MSEHGKTYEKSKHYSSTHFGVKNDVHCNSSRSRRHCECNALTQDPDDNGVSQLEQQRQ